MKSWLEDNGIEMYSTHNEGKSVVQERFVRTLKNKIYKYTTSTSKNVDADKLGILLINTTIHIIAQSKWSLALILTPVKKIKKRLLNLKLVFM